MRETWEERLDHLISLHSLWKEYIIRVESNSLNPKQNEHNDKGKIYTW
jgi:hypothetical protein